MNRRRFVHALGVWVLPVSYAHAATPQSRGNRRLAVLLFDGPEGWSSLMQELREELANLGWVEGKNLSIEWHFANGDASRLASLATQSTRSGVDAILARGTPATRALQQATGTVPILTGVGDPIGAGFARSLANPGGNITGLSYGAVETSRKQIELLHTVVPRLSRVILVVRADRSQFVQDMIGSIGRGARELGLHSEIALVSNAVELRRAWRPDHNRGVSAAVVTGLGDIAATDVADAALLLGMPTVFEYSSYVDAGGLMSFRLNWENQTQRAAAQLDKVFRGIKPAQIPFEFPTRSELVINRSTARSLGLEIPRALLARADRLVD